MRAIRKVRLAQAWVACKDCGVDNICFVTHFNMLFGIRNNISYFPRGCRMHQLQKGQGLVGKAYLSRKPYFCRDITTQFTSNEYPLLYYACHARLTQSFAICLYHTFSNNYYILEFFFTPGDWVDPQEILDSIRIRLQEFPKLRVALGESTEELHVVVLQPSMQMCQTTVGRPGNGGDNSLPTTYTSHQQIMVEEEDASSGNEVVVVNDSKKSNAIPSNPQDTKTKISISVETIEQHRGRKLEDAAERIGGEESTEELDVVVLQPSMQMCQTTVGKPGNGGDNSLPSTSHQQQQAMVEEEDASSGNDVVVNDSKKSNTIPSNPQDTKTKITISRETIEQHRGRKLEDAAESIGVSRSTLKRNLRLHGIPRWQSPKRNRANSKRDPPLPHPLPVQSVATTDRGMPDLNTMTIKAKYRNDFLKFELPFSSGLVDLKEQLSKRLESIPASYKIRYLDEEGDWVLIGCDEDLQKYMSTWRSMGMTTIKISVLPLTN